MDMDCPTLQNQRQNEEICPAMLMKCPEGPITIFVDGSWKDNGYGLDNIFIPQLIPREREDGGAGLVMMADSSDWRQRGISTLHVTNGEIVGDGGNGRGTGYC